MSGPEGARMTKGRLEAFSDGVLAIIITIMVLELKVPHGEDLESLRPLAPVFLAYVLSFLYVGIYWNNHHHLLHAVRHVDGRILWTNLHLLFWLSLFPLRALVRRHGQDSVIAHAIGSDLKGNLSLVTYVIGMAFAALGFRWPSFLVYCAVALWWFIPDLRIVRAHEERQQP
jgi:hypothetical protein